MGEPRGGNRAGRVGMALFGSCAVALCALVPLTASPAGASSPSSSWSVTTLAGTGSPGYSGDGGPATAAKLHGPSGVAVDHRGDVFVVDTDNCAVREVPAAAGTSYGIAMKAHGIYTIAGGSCTGSGGVGYPTGVAVDASGDVFIADATGNRVLELPPAGERRLGSSARAHRLTTLAGTGTAGAAGIGGPASSAELDQPTGVAVDDSGDVFIADTENCRIVEVPAAAGTRDGQAMTAHDAYAVAGTGTCGTGGLGGPATEAQLFTPTAVALDGAGDLIIANRGTGQVFEAPVAAGSYFGTSIGAGDLAVIAGVGTYGSYLVDGLSATGETAEINFPYGLALSSNGDLVVTDTAARAIRLIGAVTGTAFGESVSAGDLYTLVGNLPTGSNDDQSKWLVTKLTSPYGVALMPDGDLVFSEQGSDQVRELHP